MNIENNIFKYSEDNIITIDDGTGSGRKASVTSDHLLQTLSQTFVFDHYVNHVNRKAYSCVIEQTPAGAGYSFFYIKNNDDSDLIITSFTVYTPSVETINVYLNSSGTAVGTDYTPINRYSGSANTASVTCIVGNNVTGLTNGNLVDKIIVLGSSVGMIKHNWVSDLIIPKNTTLSLTATTGSIKINATLSFYFHSMLSHN